PPAALVVPCIALLAAAQAHAQSLPGGGQIGMTVPQLQQAVPGLKPVARPARLAGGLVGSWSGPEVDIEGIAFTPTFFFADAQLRRVEYVTTAGATAGALDALVAWGRAQCGPELASQ